MTVIPDTQTFDSVVLKQKQIYMNQQMMDFSEGAIVSVHVHGPIEQ